MLKQPFELGRGLFVAALSMAVAVTAAFTLHTAPRNGARVSFVKPASARPMLWSIQALPEETNAGGPQVELPESMKEKQRKDLRKFRFNKMKEHGDELAKLARALQEELNKSNENILSLDVVEKAQKIEKLAKKIQEEARFGT